MRPKGGRIMGVMLQAFYWDCPRVENREHQWWTFIKSKLPAIAHAGFTALWLPPANKAASWKSMGYDPYDYYDLGEFDQKGGAPTWFGSKAELFDLVGSAHALGLQLYGDLVFNHNSGADELETNPLDGQSRWTKFTPKSGMFPRDWKCFHPSQYETWDGATFGDMPDLCHINPRVSANILNNSKWLIEHIGYDGQPDGKTFDPPIDVAAAGASGLSLTCAFDNPRDVAVCWGIGDQEMCVMLGFKKSKYRS